MSKVSISVGLISVEVEARVVECQRCGTTAPVVPTAIAQGMEPGKWEEWSINQWRDPPGWESALGKRVCPICAELVRVVLSEGSSGR